MSMKPGRDRRETERLLRKNRNTLVIVGQGVIAFGLWDVIKTFLSMGLLEDTRRLYFYDSATGEKLPLAVSIPVIVILLCLTMGPRLFVGLSAISEGRGQRRRVGYLVMAALMILFNTAIFAVSVYFLTDTFDTVMDASISLAVEFTSIVTLIEMFVSGIRVKALSRQLGEAG